MDGWVKWVGTETQDQVKSDSNSAQDGKWYAIIWQADFAES